MVSFFLVIFPPHTLVHGQVASQRDFLGQASGVMLSQDGNELLEEIIVYMKKK